MQLTQALSDAFDTMGTSSPYTAGGSTGYESGVAIVPGVTSPDTVLLGSIPVRAPSFDPAPLPVLKPIDAATPSPCSTCKYGTPAGTPSGTMPSGAYLPPPGTGLPPLSSAFAPTGAVMPGTAPAAAPGALANYPAAWWILGGLLVLVLLEDRRERR